MMHFTVPMDYDFHAKMTAFRKKKGIRSNAQLARTAIDFFMNNDDTSMIEKQMKKQLLPLLDSIRTIDEINRQTQEFIELLDMRLQMKEGRSSVVYTVAGEIRNFLATGEKDLSTILTKCKAYDRETIYAALILLMEIDAASSYRKIILKDENEERKGE